MKRTRHSPEQIIAKLREADALLAGGSSIGQVCQKLEVSEQTTYSWRKHFGELASVDVKRLRALQAENNRLKRLLAERDLDI